MRIDQLLVSASRGDAVTQSAFEIRSVLRRLGPSDIYARYFEPGLIGDVRALEEYDRRPGADARRDVLCYHAAIGEPEVASFLAARPERLAVVYHNISPGHMFREYQPRLADLLDLGRQELRELAGRVEIALAPSRYNASELEEMGFKDVRVVPLVIDRMRLHGVEPHAPTAHHLTTAVKGPVALFVGQLLPHKRPDFLVEAFHMLVTYLVPEAHLILAGAGPLREYRRSLQHYINELNLSTLWLAGRVTEAELAAFFRRADVFVTASEHEGVCVPLVEAMSFDVPTVARAFSAIPETLEDGGLLLPPDDDPALMAEAMAVVMTEPDVRAALVERGRRRLAAFDAEDARAGYVKHLGDLR
ncbi:MAG TPA: glycosyltransferase family 4 protein [Acidimicrobiales bacterium]|nr:glycosyltransferase family 4 protein [Acidimicrobiales bacterium]